MTIAVTGGTGFVGQAVLEEGARRSLSIRALTRRNQEQRENIAWIGGDLHDKPALESLVSGVDAVVHIAGVVNAPDEAGFRHGNIDGTRNAVDAALAAGVRRFICVSSLSAREPGLSDYGRSKRLAEEIVQVSGLDWTIVRPPAIYGPRDTEVFELFRAAKLGVVPLPPAGRASLLHVDDLARLLLDLVPGDETTSCRIFEPDDGRPGGWSHKSMAQAIGNAMGRKVWKPAMPTWVIKTGARLDRLFRGNKAKLTPDRARYMVHPDWVCSDRMKVPEAVWTPRIETRQGLAETARWYSAAGWF